MTPPTSFTPSTTRDRDRVRFYVLKARVGLDSQGPHLDPEPDGDFVVMPTGCYYLGPHAPIWTASQRGPGSTLFGHALMVASQSGATANKRYGAMFDAALLAESYEKSRRADIVCSITHAKSSTANRRTWGWIIGLSLIALMLGGIALGEWLLAGGWSTP